MDGSVGVDGCNLNFLPLSAEETFFRAFSNGEFDVSELSLSSYMLSTSRGACPYIAIPVFVSRVFRHSAIYIRSDAGILGPENLRGRVVGVPEYQMTAALWVRGMLSDIYKVQSHEIRWRTGGLEMAGREEKISVNLPHSFELAAIPSNKTLSQMLDEGELDALITARAPSCFSGGRGNVVRLFPNFRVAETQYFQQTGLFPIMHVIGIRRDVHAKNPWLATSLYKAFSRAKAMCFERMHEIGTLSVMLPWLTSHVEETQQTMGGDFWPYGIERNRQPLQAATRYAHEQGLIDRILQIPELFVASDAQFKV